ncbi:MAG: 4Fe-4S dicluster domain-containing protein [Deltaproteobacteria bacterium]|nr:4Fe-4S dicluster domain-containing protein [Deltaproteobacteria bacterium]
MMECIHCGLCLAACPTYRELKLEMDSPRGRIYLMRAVAEGRIPMAEAFIRHMYLCLDCRACESACPSGVSFEHLVEGSRGQIQRRTEGLPGLVQPILRLVLNGLFPHPGRLELLADLLRLYQVSGLQRLVRSLHLIPPALRLGDELLPPNLPRSERRPPGSSLPPAGPPRAVAAFFTGCVANSLLATVTQATVHVLRAGGCRVLVPEQACCGALHIHAGFRDVAKGLARRNIEAFLASGADLIVTNSAGCGAELKEYRYLLREDPAYAEKAEAFSARVRDVSEVVTEFPPEALRPVPERVAYHDPCHLAHAQQIRKQPRELLRRIPGLELLEIENPDWCCGSAGIYNLLQPAMALRLLDKKIDTIAAVRPSLVATGNPGCILQIGYGMRRRGLQARVVHPVELLARACP